MCEEESYEILQGVYIWKMDIICECCFDCNNIDFFFRG